MAKYAMDAELLAAIRELIEESRGRLKNPGGQPKRGNVSIGLSSYVVKQKTTITARSGTTLGQGEVYLCEADSEGIANATTITKTVYNSQAKSIALTTTGDTYLDIQQTNWGIYTVVHPTHAVNACEYFDGVKIADISGRSSGVYQFLAISTAGCLLAVTPTTCT